MPYCPVSLLIFFALLFLGIGLVAVVAGYFTFVKKNRTAAWSFALGVIWALLIIFLMFEWA